MLLTPHLVSCGQPAFFTHHLHMLRNFLSKIFWQFISTNCLHLITRQFGGGTKLASQIVSLHSRLATLLHVHLRDCKIKFHLLVLLALLGDAFLLFRCMLTPYILYYTLINIICQHFFCHKYTCFILYALFNSKRNLSAIIAINSLFVGFPFAAETVYPKIFSIKSTSPLPQATSIA